MLAVGHSARDTFAMLHKLGAPMSPKPFSIGARIEHAQALIDRAQYGGRAGHPALPAAEYRLSAHLPDGRAAYTFCMCPGGTVVAAASEAGGVVTNGMSPFARDGRNANSALLISVSPADFPGDDPLGGVRFQREWERAALRTGGSENFRAPAQRVGDFLQGVASGGRGRRGAQLSPRRCVYRPFPLPSGLRRARHARGHPPLSTGACAASRTRARCSPARRRAPVRPCASSATPTAKAPCAASTPAARARATPAAYSPRRWTASNALNARRRRKVKSMENAERELRIILEALRRLRLGRPCRSRAALPCGRIAPYGAAGGRGTGARSLRKLRLRPGRALSAARSGGCEVRAIV